MARDGSCPEAPTVSGVRLFVYRWEKKERRVQTEVPGDPVAWVGHRQKLPVLTETSLLGCFHPLKPNFCSDMSPATSQEPQLF